MKNSYLLTTLLFIITATASFSQTVFVNEPQGIGIGTTGPEALLHLRKDVNASIENWVLKLQNNNFEYQSLPTVGMLFAAGDVQSQKAGIIFRRTGGHGIGNMYFLNNSKVDTSFPTVANDAVLTLLSGGNIGMGTNAPLNSLDVSRDSENHGVRIARTGLNPGAVSFQVHSYGKGVFATQNNFAVNAGTAVDAFLVEHDTGNVGIGTITPNEKLAVNGKIRAKEVKVESTNWPDYVFEKDYNLTPLLALEKYIIANKHLPEVPTGKEIEANGVALGEMNRLLMKKVEELTLHLIEKEKQMHSLQTDVEMLKKLVLEVKK